MNEVGRRVLAATTKNRNRVPKHAKPNLQIPTPPKRGVLHAGQHRDRSHAAR